MSAKQNIITINIELYNYKSLLSSNDAIKLVRYVTLW